MFCSSPHTIKLVSVRDEGKIDVIFEDMCHVVFHSMDEEDYQEIGEKNPGFIMPEIKTVDISDDMGHAIINGTMKIPADRLYGLGVKIADFKEMQEDL